MTEEEEESTGIDFKYHFITFLYIIAAVGIIFLTNFNNPGYSDMKLGEASAPLIFGIIIYRWMRKK